MRLTGPMTCYRRDTTGVRARIYKRIAFKSNACIQLHRGFVFRFKVLVKCIRLHSKHLSNNSNKKKHIEFLDSKANQTINKLLNFRSFFFVFALGVFLSLSVCFFAILNGYWHWFRSEVFFIDHLRCSR